MPEDCSQTGFTIRGLPAVRLREAGLNWIFILCRPDDRGRRAVLLESGDRKYNQAAYERVRRRAVKALKGG